MGIYIVECKQGKNWAETRPYRDALGRKIAWLAKAHGASFSFHGYQDRVDNTPFVMIECDRVFLFIVQHLEEALKVSEAPRGIKTVRSQKLARYFSNPAKPSGPAPK